MSDFDIDKWRKEQWDKHKELPMGDYHIVWPGHFCEYCKQQEYVVVEVTRGGWSGGTDINHLNDCKVHFHDDCGKRWDDCTCPRSDD